MQQALIPARRLGGEGVLDDLAQGAAVRVAFDIRGEPGILGGFTPGR
jgi:hypothetical protein